MPAAAPAVTTTMTTMIAKILLVLATCAILASDAGYPKRSREGQLLDIMVPRILLEEFEYVPTKEGYRYSYKLADGTTREEIGIITNPGTPQADMIIMGAFSREDKDSVTTTMFTEDSRQGFRPRGMTKNRKLSPKSLQSLAG